MAKRLLTKARDAFMEKADKKLNRLKDAYEEENHGDLTIGKIERIGQLSKDIKDYEAYVKEVLDGWEFVDEKRLGEIVLALDESEAWRLPKNSRKLYREMQAETVGQKELVLEHGAAGLTDSREDVIKKEETVFGYEADVWSSCTVDSVAGRICNQCEDYSIGGRQC